MVSLAGGGNNGRPHQCVGIKVDYATSCVLSVFTDSESYGTSVRQPSRSRMKEILYLQLGNISNHIGTHFWNTQESYFTYDEDEDPYVNHDISFREGLSPHASMGIHELIEIGLLILC